jgi:hypothetical protein
VNDDCDDSDSSINPGATDIPDDGIDQDCSGYDATAVDVDGDGYDANHDCDDNDPTINSGAIDIPNDGIDQDCDGSDLVGTCPTESSISTVGSSVYSTTSAPTNNQVMGSCNSYDPAEYMVEWLAPARGCATIDTFGTGEDTVLSIHDECPGYGNSTELACNDEAPNSTTFLGESELNVDVEENEAYYIAIEGWYTTLTSANLNISIDSTQDCDGNPLDQDGDGYDPSTDCDDSDSSINPGATEIPGDGVDQNCDELESCYIDIDGDGFGSDQDNDNDGSIDTIPSIDLLCDGLLESDNSDDCNDWDSSVNPAALEITSDGIDQDCDGSD